MSKDQGPMSKDQCPRNEQSPGCRDGAVTRRAVGDWELELPWTLVFGPWSLHTTALAFHPSASHLRRVIKNNHTLTMAHELPALPYATTALEPHIDAKTMEIHHGKHHAAYVEIGRAHV